RLWLLGLASCIPTLITGAIGMGAIGTGDTITATKRIAAARFCLEDCAIRPCARVSLYGLPWRSAPAPHTVRSSPIMHHEPTRAWQSHEHGKAPSALRLGAPGDHCFLSGDALAWQKRERCQQSICCT